MKKKILALFTLIMSLSIVNVYADKEYKFTINNTLSNKEITYTWENSIDNFNFEMVSPSKIRYSIANYDNIEYDGNKNRISVRFSELEQGTWKVFFKGDSNPVGLKNTIKDYTPQEEVKDFGEPTSSSQDDIEETKSSSDIIIIGAPEPTTIPEEPKEEIEDVKEEVEIEEPEKSEEKTDEEVIEEENSEEILERKALLKAERDAARSIQKEILSSYSKPIEKIEEVIDEELVDDTEEENEDGEVLLNFDDISNLPVEELKDDETQQVIFMGGEETTEVNVNSESLVTGTDDLTIVNINADEERAKERARQERIKANQTRNNILMVLPLFIGIILTILDIIFEIKRKKTVGMVDYNLKDFDNYVDRSEESDYRQEDFGMEEEVTEVPEKKKFSLFGKKTKNIPVEDDEPISNFNVENPLEVEDNDALMPPVMPSNPQGFGFSSEDSIEEDDSDFNEFRPPVNSGRQVSNDSQVDNNLSKTKSKKNLFGGDDSLSFKKTKVEDEEDFNWDE